MFIALGCYKTLDSHAIMEVSGGAGNTPDAVNLYGRSTMQSIASPRFYVYVLARPDGTPFYVGKGQGSRIDDHERQARRGLKGHRFNIIRKIWRTGGQVQKYILFTTDDEAEAHRFEIEWIAVYGRENLCNQTDGGEGASHPTRATTTKRVNSVRAWWTSERRARQAAEAKASWADPIRREKRYVPLVAALRNPEELKRKSAASKAVASTDEAKARTAMYAKARWDDPEARQRQLDAIRAAITPERQAKKATAIKASWTDPEVRAKRIAGLKAAAANPELRAKKREAAKAWWAERKAGKDKTP